MYSTLHDGIQRLMQLLGGFPNGQTAVYVNDGDIALVADIDFHGIVICHFLGFGGHNARSITRTCGASSSNLSLRRGKYTPLQDCDQRAHFVSPFSPTETVTNRPLRRAL